MENSNSITPDKIRQNNQNLIYRYIYENKNVSQQDICNALHLSRPTVTGKLSELERDGLICKRGQINTEYVGRKAVAYGIVPDYRVSLGVEILNDEIKMIAIDLYGSKINRHVQKMQYENSEKYYRKVSEQILAFIQTLPVSADQILGIGFALQALIAPDQETVIYGKILDCTGLSVDVFTQHLPYPCAFFHDADCAAISELWVSPETKDGFYLSVSRHLGAAMINDGRILSGKHGHNATIEHIQMKSDGAVCYCGKQGCMDTLCSLSALLDEEETAESFFRQLYTGDADCTERWMQFLSDLASSVNLLHLIYDKDFILGGYLAPYLREEDLNLLHEKIRQLTPFAEKNDFIHVSKMPEHNITIGAALPFIQEFLRTNLS